MIVVWFGLVMVGQAFTEVPKSHSIAVAFGLVPILASWAVGLVDLALRKGGSSFLVGRAAFWRRIADLRADRAEPGRAFGIDDLDGGDCAHAGPAISSGGRLAAFSGSAFVRRAYPRVPDYGQRRRDGHWHLCSARVRLELSGRSWIPGRFPFLRCATGNRGAAGRRLLSLLFAVCVSARAFPHSIPPQTAIVPT